VIGKMYRGLKRLPFYSVRGRDRNEMNELLGFTRHSPSPLQHHMGIWPCHVSDSSLGSSFTGNHSLNSITKINLFCITIIGFLLNLNV
jgi:hypothetical protein